jgi:hypothetical protein
MASVVSSLFDRLFGWAAAPAAYVRPAPAGPDLGEIGWSLPRQQQPAAPGPRLASPSEPPSPPRRPTSQRPTPPEPPTPPTRRRRSPEPPRRARELAWLTWQLPAALRQPTTRSLRETLRWRARECEPLSPPLSPVARSRFGLRGEQLVPCAVAFLCDLLLTELRESVRTLEASLSWSERNWRLAMHSIRLSQLCADLERRGSVDVLEVICAGLEPLWN